jgi:hypothetical protein
MAMHQSNAEEFEALERLRWAIARLGYARTVRGLAAIAHDEAQHCLQAGNRQRAAYCARTYQVLSQVIVALSHEESSG